MDDEFAMMLCNVSVHEVTWTVTPDGDEPVKVVQLSHQYGSISLPMAESYLITCGEAQAKVRSPSVAAVFTDPEIAVCTPA